MSRHNPDSNKSSMILPLKAWSKPNCDKTNGENSTTPATMLKKTKLSIRLVLLPKKFHSVCIKMDIQTSTIELNVMDGLLLVLALMRLSWHDHYDRLYVCRSNPHRLNDLKKTVVVTTTFDLKINYNDTFFILWSRKGAMSQRRQQRPNLRYLNAYSSKLQ